MCVKQRILNNTFWENYWNNTQIKTYNIKLIKKNSPFLRIIKKSINEYLPKRTLSIFEFGCGSGIISLNLALDDHNVFATDLSKDVINNLNDTVNKINVEYKTDKLKYKTDILDLYQIGDYEFYNCYDLILNYSTLEFIDKDNIQNIINKLYDITKRDGLFIFTIPVQNLIKLKCAPLFPYWKKRIDRTYTSTYNKEEYDKFIESSNYSFIKLEYLGPIPTNTFEDYSKSIIIRIVINVINQIFYLLPRFLKKYIAFNVLIILRKD